jgi:hypothetical protein
MNICIKGVSRNLTKTEIKDILHWMIVELRLDRYKNPIFIEVDVIKNLFKKTGAMGFGTWEDTNYRPREFSIDMDAGLTKKHSIRTLIHEMIHISQFAKGKMQDLLLNNSLKKWCKEVINQDELDYEQHPWEQEAYRLEDYYYKLYKNKKRRKR